MSGQNPNGRFNILARDGEGPDDKSTAMEANPSQAQTDSSKPSIASHDALHLDNDALKIELDFRKPLTFFKTGEGDAWKISLFDILPKYGERCAKIYIDLYPVPRNQKQDWDGPKVMEPFREDVVRKVVAILNDFRKITSIKIMLHCLLVTWDRVRILKPFYGLRFLRRECRIRAEGGSEVKLIDGDCWDKRLKLLRNT